MFAAVALSVSNLGSAQEDGTISGTVSDFDTGQPISGVRIGADLQQLGGGQQQIPGVLSDASGAYTITGLKTGMYKLEWSVPSGYSQWQSRQEFINLTSGKNYVHNIQLSKGRDLNGVVIDGLTGEPVSSARVGVGIMSNADADGRFTLHNVPHDANTVSAHKEGYWWGRTAITPETKTVEIKLYKAPVAQGFVRDASTGEPITQFSALFIHETSDPYAKERKLSQSEDGSFQVALTSKAKGFRIHFFAPGYADYVYALDIPEPGTVLSDVIILMDPAEGRSGSVLTMAGDPVADAILLRAPVPTVAEQRKLAALATSDAKGDFFIDVLGKSDRKLFVIAPGHPPKWVDIDPESDDLLEIVLENGESLTGRVTIDDKPAKGVQISAQITSSRISSHELGPISTDEHGVYAFASVPPGSLMITLEVPGNPRLTTLKHGVDIEAGTPAVVDFDLSTRTGIVEGYLQMSDGRPLEGSVMLDANAGILFPTKTGPDGSFRFEDIPAGPAVIFAQVSSLHSQKHKTSIEIVPDIVIEVNVVLPGSTNINLRATNIPAGKSVFGALMDSSKYGDWDYSDPEILVRVNSRSVNWSSLKNGTATLPATPKGEYILVMQAVGNRAIPNDTIIKLYDVTVSGEPEIDIVVDFAE